MAELSIKEIHSLVNNYEVALQNISGELSQVQDEQNSIKNLLEENSQLRTELTDLLDGQASTCQTEHQFKETDLITNLQAQLKSVIDEKESVIQLWQSAVQNIDYLETELKIYQDNTQGLVPKHKLTQLKESYEEKLNKLEATLGKTKGKLEETINLASKRLQIREEELTGSIQSHDKTFKIIKNLEDEVLKLQKRLDEADKTKKRIEKEIHDKNSQVEKLTQKNKDCVNKVEDALQVVEAAIKEKDAALFRESKAKEEILSLSRALLEVLNNSGDNAKSEVNATKTYYEQKLEKLVEDLKKVQEEIRERNMQLENSNKKCAILEKEVERMQSTNHHFDESNTSKMVVLEKNFESTFQKLLISEKQNIQLKAEKDSMKMDLDQMAQFYERDIKTRDAERAALKTEISDLKMQLNECHKKLQENAEQLVTLKDTIAKSEAQYNEEIRLAKSALQQVTQERDELEKQSKENATNLKEQLSHQMENNQKWRDETKEITARLEERIKELKTDLSRKRSENRILAEKLSQSGNKMDEYKKFLEMISCDVNRISGIANAPNEDLSR